MKENKVRMSDIVSGGIPESEPDKGPHGDGRNPGAIRLSELKNLMSALQTKSPAEKKESERSRTDLIRIKDLLTDAEPSDPTSSEPQNLKQDISHSGRGNKDQKKGLDLNLSGIALFGRETKKQNETLDNREFASPVSEERPISTAKSEEKKASLVSFPDRYNEVEIYNKFTAILNTIKARVKNGREFSIEPVSDLILDVIRTPDLLRNLYQLTIAVPHNSDYNISHQVNTMVYALKIGKGFSFTEKRLHELATSALLHDVGMFLIPENITNKYEKLTSNDLNAIKQHPMIGRKILDVFSAHPWLADVAYHHHERENGQGYPEGFRGNQISEYAKIVGIVDSYEAMTHNRPYRKALMQAFSAKELIKSKNMLFSPSVIKVFLKEISLYPLGSFVRLNNKAIGQVIGTDRTRPLRPDIKVIFDSEGNRVNEPTILRLDQNPIYYIQDSVSESELPSLLFSESAYRISG